MNKIEQIILAPKPISFSMLQSTWHEDGNAADREKEEEEEEEEEERIL